MILVTKAEGTLQRYEHPNLGRLIQPRHYDSRVGGRVWGADNDAFNGGFDPDAFTGMLETVAGKPRCLFVAAPDVVADADATLDLFDEWEPRIRSYRLPVALVGQDGMTSEDIPWGRIDAFFIGGSTEWKLSVGTAQLVREAKARRKWVHMGRVNSLRRLQYADSIGCDSADGTAVCRFTDTYLPKFLKFAAQPTQLGLSLN